ncbi:MAG TPA: hypothetical protein VHE54_07340 [Puia sp.]|nr:hypothetical protein [Puia sp.]
MKSNLVIIGMIVAGSLIAGTTNAQVQVHVGINESTYPGYTYYTYPSWRGHYRDRVYYEHYHGRFYREHRAYFAGNRFDHERFEREHHWRDRDHHDRDRHDRDRH